MAVWRKGSAGAAELEARRAERCAPGPEEPAKRGCDGETELLF